MKEFRRSELLEKYTVKILFKWDNRKFEDEYLKKLKKIFGQDRRECQVSLEEKP